MCQPNSTDCLPGLAIVGGTLVPVTFPAGEAAILASDRSPLFGSSPFSLRLQTVPGPADDEDDDEDDDDAGGGGGNIEPDDDEGYDDEDDEDDDEEPWQVRTRGQRQVRAAFGGSPGAVRSRLAKACSDGEGTGWAARAAREGGSGRR